MNKLLGLLFLVGISLTAQTISHSNSTVVNTEEKLLGVLQYNGGFEQDVRLNLATPEIVRQIRFAVPAFCKDVEITETDAVTETAKVKATLINHMQHIYVVNHGVGQKIIGVEATMNGPKQLQCAIPVYIRTVNLNPPAPVAETNKANIFVCNKTLRYSPIFGMAYLKDGAFVTEGWWKIPRGQCVMIKKEFQGPVYGHAYDPRMNAVWGQGIEFCVNHTKVGIVEQKTCELGEVGAGIASFSKFELPEKEGNYYWELH